MLERNSRIQTTRSEVSNHEFGYVDKPIKYRLEIIDSNWLQSILAPVWSGLDPVYTVWIQFLLELPYDGRRCWVQTVCRKTARKRHFSNLMLKLLMFVSRSWFDQAFDRLKPFVSSHQRSPFNRIDICPAYTTTMVELGLDPVSTIRNGKWDGWHDIECNLLWTVYFTAAAPCSYKVKLSTIFLLRKNRSGNLGYQILQVRGIELGDSIRN